MKEGPVLQTVQFQYPVVSFQSNAVSEYLRMAKAPCSFDPSSSVVVPVNQQALCLIVCLHRCIQKEKRAFLCNVCSVLSLGEKVTSQGDQQTCGHSVFQSVD